ncbi:MAG: hypothetical protein ACKPJJ_29680, partial [Planctomycetaceae bacterium]
VLAASDMVKLRSRGIHWIVVTDAESVAMAAGQEELLQKWSSSDGMEAVFRVGNSVEVDVPSTRP